jgi:hypothetical protein
MVTISRATVWSKIVPKVLSPGRGERGPPGQRRRTGGPDLSAPTRHRMTCALQEEGKGREWWDGGRRGWGVPVGGVVEGLDVFVGIWIAWRTARISSSLLVALGIGFRQEAHGSEDGSEAGRVRGAEGGNPPIDSDDGPKD